MKKIKRQLFQREEGKKKRNCSSSNIDIHEYYLPLFSVQLGFWGFGVRIDHQIWHCLGESLALVQLLEALRALQRCNPR